MSTIFKIALETCRFFSKDKFNIVLLQRWETSIVNQINFLFIEPFMKHLKPSHRIRSEKNYIEQSHIERPRETWKCIASAQERAYCEWK